MNSNTQNALRFITCGSVDDGKSTLIGRLLVDTKAVLQDHLAGVQRQGETENLPHTCSYHASHGRSSSEHPIDIPATSSEPIHIFDPGRRVVVVVQYPLLARAVCIRGIECDVQHRAGLRQRQG